jgi:nitronate monooxygenase
MSDARSLIASLAMGASGMNMGTRFIATREAPVHDNVKQALVKASDTSGLSCFHSLGFFEPDG